MTKKVEHGNSSGGVRTAFLIGGIWVILMAILWYLTEGAAEEEENGLLIFLGRFHPLLVHVPIGLIVLVPIFELLGRKESWSHLRQCVPLVLWITVLGALASSVFGYMLMQGEQVESALMTRHLWVGIAVGFLALATLVFKLAGKATLFGGSLVLSLVAIALSGHFGGALVHGKGYLAAHAPEFLRPLLMVGFPENGDSGTEVAVAAEESEEVPIDDKIVFTDFVLPVLDAKCNECHNEEKTKGKLRLDTHELILAGAEGADYPNVEPGNSDESEMVFRVTLPADDDDFMPPDGKDSLTPIEIKLLRWWIDTGASAEATVAEAETDEEMFEVLIALEAEFAGRAEAGELAEMGPISEWDLLTPEERIERLDGVMAAAEQYNFSVMPISAEDDRLRVNVINAAKEFGDEELALLEPMAERVVWLDLARSQVTDSGMATVGRMRNLERLHLENTGVTDKGIASLGRLTKIEYLNLYGTEVTAAIFETLANMGDLRKLYVWQTKVDPASARAFQRSMSLEVNTGYELAVSDANAEESQPDADKAPPEKEPEKPAPAAAKPKPEKPAAIPPKPEPKPAPEKKPATPARKESPEKPKSDQSQPPKPEEAPKKKAPAA